MSEMQSVVSVSVLVPKTTSHSSAQWYALRSARDFYVSDGMLLLFDKSGEDESREVIATFPPDRWWGVKLDYAPGDVGVLAVPDDTEADGDPEE